jgi:hypothetical protein
MSDPATPAPRRSPLAKGRDDSDTPTSGQMLLAAVFSLLSAVGVAFGPSLPSGQLAASLFGAALLAAVALSRGMLGPRPILSALLAAAAALIFGAGASLAIRHQFDLGAVDPANYLVAGIGAGAAAMALLSRVNVDQDGAIISRFACLLLSAVVFAVVMATWLFGAGVETRAILTAAGCLLLVPAFGTLLPGSVNKTLGALVPGKTSGSAMLGGAALYAQLVSGVTFYVVALALWGDAATAVAHAVRHFAAGL